MALLNKTQIETLSDSIAAKAIAARNGFLRGSFSNAKGTLFSQIDSTNSPTVEGALTEFAYNLDQSLWDTTQIDRVVVNLFSAFVGRLVSQVKGEGTYNTFDAYLTGIGAQVHPVFAAMIGGVSAANVYSPPIETLASPKVYAGADGALVDITDAAASSALETTTVMENDGEAIYIAYDRKPTTNYDFITFALSVLADVSCVLNVKYYNGMDWVTLATSDEDTTGTYANTGTKGFTQNGAIRFQVAANWERTAYNPAGDLIDSADKTARYYIRIERTADTLTTEPVVTTIRTGVGMGLAFVKPDSSLLFVPGVSSGSTYDAPNKIALRALTTIGNITGVKVTYTNRAGTTGRKTTTADWTGIDAQEHLPSNGALTLQTDLEGVAAATGIEGTTAATSGVFAIESQQVRTEAL